MTHILLIRHAQSANNALPEHQRVPDPGLTELGVKQAALTAAALSSQRLTHLYCSPFLRSLETLRPLADSKQLPVSIRGDIFEQGGCYSGYAPGEERGEPGMGCEELQTRYPHWHVDQRIEAAGWWGKPYESLDEATLRAQRVAKWMVQQLVPMAGIHLFVVHADFKRLLIAALLGQHADQVMPIIGPLHNVGITRFEWNGLQWQLNCLNATSHLPADYVT